MPRITRLLNRHIRGGTRRSAPVFLWVVFVAGLANIGLAKAGPTREVIGVRHFTAPGHTRVVLDMSGPGSFEVRRVAGPDRLAINIGGASLGVAGPLAVSDGLVRQVRLNAGVRRAQVVVDLEARAEFRSFSLPATAGRHDRIVVDVLRPGHETAPDLEAPDAAPDAAPEPALKPFTVVIDPGHGGLDPGAVRDGIAEKDVVLDIGRELARLLNAQPGYRAHLTRTGDYGLELWQRVEYARRQGGDVFLSIHCNTHPRADVDGMEVYFLSLQGATDRESQELADAENAAELVGLDPARDHDELVMDILMDLKMTQVLKESARLSHHILDAGKSSGLVGGRKVKQAGFQVLRSLAMPSALVEVAYLSNPQDHKVLADRRGRRDLAGLILQGLMAWRQDGPAIARLDAGRRPGWTRSYQVRRGDSLWGLARRHGTTVSEISLQNNLQTGAINVGQLLRLPEADQKP